MIDSTADGTFIHRKKTNCYIAFMSSFKLFRYGSVLQFSGAYVENIK